MDYTYLGHIVASPSRLLGPSAYQCDGCGAVVTDQEAHDFFHTSLSRTARQASSADALTHVIGGTQ